MPKTTKGDGMELMAERWLRSYKHLLPNHWEKFELVSLTRLLRKVAREAASRQREYDLGVLVNGLSLKEMMVKYPDKY